MGKFWKESSGQMVFTYREWKMKWKSVLRASVEGDRGRRRP